MSPQVGRLTNWLGPTYLPPPKGIPPPRNKSGRASSGRIFSVGFTEFLAKPIFLSGWQVDHPAKEGSDSNMK